MFVGAHMFRSPVLLSCGLIAATLIFGGLLEKKLDAPPPPVQASRATPAPIAQMPTAPQAPQVQAANRPPGNPFPNNDMQQGQGRRAGTVELRADKQGHFNAPVEINGRAFTMLVDTGATVLTLSHEDARKALLIVPTTDFKVPIQTAGGQMKVAAVKLNRVAIGPISVRDLQAYVLPPGVGAPSLLGMNFLRSLSSYEVKDNKMIMRN